VIEQRGDAEWRRRGHHPRRPRAHRRDRLRAGGGHYRPGFDFTGVERLEHRTDEELLLRALSQTFLDHSLCSSSSMHTGTWRGMPAMWCGTRRYLCPECRSR